MRFKKEQPPERRRPIQSSSQRSAVFSYYASRSPRPGSVGRELSGDESTPDRKQPRLRKQSVLHLLAGAGVIVLCIFLLRLDGQPRIVSVEADAGSIFLQDQSRYEAAATQAFASWTQRNKLTINSDAIAAELERSFPELEAVSVSLPLIGSQPTVYIQPVKPALILATASNQVYVLDVHGRAVAAGKQMSALSKLQLPVITDESTLIVKSGSIALPRTTVAFIDEVMFQLKEQGKTVQSAVLPAGLGELHIRMQGAGHYVKYNLYGNAREEVGAYLALMQRLESERKTPKEYIDVRVEQRVYYK